MSKPRWFAAAVLLSALILGPISARAETAAHKDIEITYDGEFTRANGVRSGRGTMRDPYVISGWEIGNITIKDTTRAVRILNNRILGTLTLDWIGPSVVVRGNEMADLRVNQNVPRWGDATGGLIRNNTIDSVGQLRHFDGKFIYNRVGAPSGSLGGSFPEVRAVNFDGFNGALFASNEIYGYVDARLHGHHHSSRWGDGSHAHAAGPHEAGATEHSDRWHEVVIKNNRIYSGHTYALAYLDTDHAANDRTAASETNPWLNAPHVHHTRAHIMNNRLFGAGILVDVFNAKDSKHKGIATGMMHLLRNTVTLEQRRFYPLEAPRNGIEILRADKVRLMLEENTILAPPPVADVELLRSMQLQGSGILLHTLNRAKVMIMDTKVANRRVGIQGTQLSKTVIWSIHGLETEGVVEPVAYDESVRNEPRMR